MTGPSKPAASDGQLPGVDHRKRMDSLAFRVQRLIDQELESTLPRKGKTARESSIVQLGFELYDADGNLIFG